MFSISSYLAFVCKFNLSPPQLQSPPPFPFLFQNKTGSHDMCFRSRAFCAQNLLPWGTKMAPLWRSSIRPKPAIPGANRVASSASTFSGTTALTSVSVRCVLKGYSKFFSHNSVRHSVGTMSRTCLRHQQVFKFEWKSEFGLRGW